MASDQESGSDDETEAPEMWDEALESRPRTWFKLGILIYRDIQSLVAKMSNGKKEAAARKKKIAKIDGKWLLETRAAINSLQYPRCYH